MEYKVFKGVNGDGVGQPLLMWPTMENDGQHQEHEKVQNGLIKSSLKPGRKSEG